MTLTNLTAEQVWLLNNLWNIQTMEELVCWKNTLPESQQALVESLIEMLKHEGLEEDLERSDYGDASDVLSKYRLAK